MASSVGLKTSFAPVNHHDAFYTGGKVQASSDGQFLFCTCGTKVNVLNVTSGSVELVIERDEMVITCFVVSPDDKYLVTADQAVLRQWDWKRKKVLRTWKLEHKCPVTCMAFDPTSTLLATGSADSTVKVWDVVRQYCTNNLRGHQGVVSLVQFHPDTNNCRLLTASDDYVIRLWDLQTHNCLGQFEGHYSTVTCLQFQNNGAIMYSASRDGSVFVWDARAYQRTKLIAISEPIESLVLLPKSKGATSDEDHFLTAGTEGILKVWNAANSKCVFRSKETNSNDRFLFADYVKAQDAILAVTEDCNIYLYSRKDVTLCKEVKQFSGNNDEIYCVRFLGADDSHIAMATNANAIKIFDLSTWSCQILTGHTDIVMTLDACVIDGVDHLVSGSKDNTVRIWTMNADMKQLECQAVGVGHCGTVCAVALLRRAETFVVSGSNDQSLKLWKFVEDKDGERSLRVKQTIVNAHSREINTVAVSPNGRFIATGSLDKTAKLWDSETLSQLAVFRGHSRGLQCVQFSPMENILGTSSMDKTIKLWELKNFKCTKTFEGHEMSVLSFSFLSRGLQLISSGGDGLIKLWSVRTNECTKTFDEHEDKIWALAINKSEDRMISGDASSKIVIWKDRTEEEREEQRTKTEKFVQNEQRLMNLMQKKKYGKALSLTILLEQPFRALTILKEMWKTPTREEDLTSALRQMRPDQIQSMLEFVSVWNANSKHSHVAQAVLATIFQMYSPAELLEFPEIRKLVENLLPFTERHFSRLKQLEQKSEFIDFSCLMMRTLEPMEMEQD